MEVTFAPRPEYGQVRPLLEDTAIGIFVHGGADVLAFSTPVAFALADGGAIAKPVLHTGDVLGFALHHRNAGPVPPVFWS